MSLSSPIRAIAGLGFLLAVHSGQAAAQSSASQASAKQEMPGMALIPAGEFWMGRVTMFLFDELSWTARDRIDDQPSHLVYLDAFNIDKYEVTNEDYARFAEAAGHRKPWHWQNGKISRAQEKQPVFNVDWNDASAYCAWAGKRLPSEAEWEKAARGGLDRKLYSWGDELGGSLAERNTDAASENLVKKMAHYQFPNGPAAVGSYPPNGYGLYDMTGNVWEWVADWYDRDYYPISPARNPKGPDTGKYRVLRGGGWSNEEDQPKTGQRSLLGVHYRNYAPPAQTSIAYGFRCARSAVE